MIEPNVPYHKPSLANSAPELNLKSKQTPVEQNTTTTTTTTTKLYQLSTGSAVDINNFGKIINHHLFNLFIIMIL